MKKIYVIISAIVLILGIVILSVKIVSSPTIPKIADKISAIASQKETASQKVVSFVSPHHLAAKGLIDNIFQKVAQNNGDDSVESIILVSPNHKNAGNGWVAVSGEIRSIENGTVEPNEKFIKFLTDEKLAYLQDEIFHGEHGIENLLPYAKKYFPKAKITSLIIRDGYPDDKAELLAEKLSDFDGGKTVLILSADFSHYVGKTVSDFHDQKSISILSNLELGKAKNMDIDCQGGLYLLMKYSTLKGCDKFNLVDNSNSANLYGQDLILENTSYVTGYYSVGTKQLIENTSLLFAGDAMLDRYIFTVAKKRGAGFLTQKMQRIFLGPDEIVFNLEGPVTKNSSVSKETLIGDKGNMRFTFDANVTKDFLRSIRASSVFIGNNHVLDFGQAGFDDTKNFLTETQIPFFSDAGGENQPLERKIGATKIAYVAFNQFLGQPAEKIVEEIRELKKTNDFVVLYAHWGVEYARTESEKQKEWAHDFVDAGADLVIGSHPHVVQPVEIYKNKAIFYSLGNFVFDQYFSPETMEGLAVGVSVKDNNLDFYLSPLSLNRDGSTTLAQGEKKDGLLLWLAENSTISSELKNGLKDGHFQIENK